MRVLMTTDTVGGVWTYAVDLCAALGRAGCDITLVTMGAAMSPDQRQTIGEVPSVEVIEAAHKLEWMPGPWEDVQRAGELLIDTALRVRPDVVHLNDFAHGALAWHELGAAGVVVVGHSCVETWWRAVKRESTGPEWRRYRDVVRRGIHGADVFVAPTAEMLRAFSTCYGRHRAGRVIHNGRDPSRYRAWAKQPRILAAGRLWDEAKNIAALARASAWLDWPVRVAGAVCEPGHEKEDAASAVECGDQRAGAGVEFVGRLTPTQLANEMGSATIYALPARYEPFGLSAVEAAVSGCALVLGDLDTLHEVWGEAALFVDPDSPRAIAEQINALIANRPRRERLADAAQRWAKRYTASRMADQYLRLYRELVGLPQHEPVRSQGVTA